METAIRMLRAAVGSVFAHPFARPPGARGEPSVIVDLAAAGLAGVEVDHPDHSPEDRDLLRVWPATRPAHHRLQRLPRHHKTTPLAAERTTGDTLEALLAQATGAPLL